MDQNIKARPTKPKIRLTVAGPSGSCRGCKVDDVPGACVAANKVVRCFGTGPFYHFEHVGDVPSTR